MQTWLPSAVFALVPILEAVASQKRAKVIAFSFTNSRHSILTQQGNYFCYKLYVVLRWFLLSEMKLT